MPTTISISVASAREFQKRVTFIQRNDLLPILSNLKLEYANEHWQLVKNNLAAVCIGEVEATGDPATVLLDERIFFALLTATKAERLTITIDDKVQIFDGEQNTDLPLEDPANYPVTPVVPSEQVPLQINERLLRAIGIASHFITPGETSGNFQFVHLAAGSVFGFHNNFFYINQAFAAGELPEVSLRADECEVITATEGVGFVDLPNHHVYLNGAYTYIFTKSEAKPLNIVGVVDRLQQPGKEVTLGRAGLVDFCNLANIVSETPLAMCLMEPGEGGVRLSLKDANYNRGTERLLQATGEPEAFAFNSRLLAPVLKVLPYEQLEAKTNQNCLIVSGRGGAGAGLGTEANEWFCFIGLQR